MAAARLAIAAIVLLIAGALTRSARAGRTSRRENVVLAFAGIALAAHFATWIASLEYTSVAVSTLVVATTPIWTAIYDALVLKRRYSPLAVAAFVAGMAGMVMVVAFDTAKPPHAGHEALGWLLAWIGSLAIGAYFILVREVRSGLRTRQIVTRTYSWAAAALVLAAVLAREPLPPLQAGAAWGGIAAMAFISQLLGHTALNAALRWFSPSAIAFSTLLEPVAAAALALLLFHEPVPPLAILGGCLLLASIAAVLREDRAWTNPIV